MGEYHALGEGVPIAANDASWQDKWHPLTEIDRDEFEREPVARFLVREMNSVEIAHFASPRRTFRPGAIPLVVVFRSGHRRYFVTSPGWLALSRYIRDATHALEQCPLLAGDAIIDLTPSHLFDASTAAEDDLSAQVSPLVSGFIYVDAPGFMSFGIFGARIYRGFKASELSFEWGRWIGSWQHQIDSGRRFDRQRLRSYDGPFVFPRTLLTAQRRRRHGI